MEENKEKEVFFQEDLTITNDFMFNRVMRNPEICGEFLTDLLPEIKIGKLNYVQTQRDKRVKYIPN